MDNERSEAAGRPTAVEAFWADNLKLLEDQINTSSPRLHFLSAHGSLFSAIVWLQSQMARLLVAKRCQTKNPSISLYELWYNRDYQKQHEDMLNPELDELHQSDFSHVAKEFRSSFRLSRDEDLALSCVECLRNMLAHGNLSIFFRDPAGTGPSLVYYPRKLRGPCFKCQPSLKHEHTRRGIRVDFNPDLTKVYFQDVRTVGAAVERIASDLKLQPVDLW
ncbi:MAG: hypothetical protein F4Y80_09520 [Caldilineaceae bacterium SB0665_bin_21]|nr:hypothetical protein [Caldilineaceae bacterium SB0665_bin_21]